MVVSKPKIRLDFADFWYPDTRIEKQNSDFYRLLSQRFEIELSDSPDFLVYSCFGQRHLDYRCVRIFYTGENSRPDFDECDFAFSFDLRVRWTDRRLSVRLTRCVASTMMRWTH